MMTWIYTWNDREWSLSQWSDWSQLAMCVETSYCWLRLVLPARRSPKLFGVESQLFVTCYCAVGSCSLCRSKGTRTNQCVLIIIIIIDYLMFVLKDYQKRQRNAICLPFQLAVGRASELWGKCWDSTRQWTGLPMLLMRCKSFCHVGEDPSNILKDIESRMVWLHPLKLYACVFARHPFMTLSGLCVWNDFDFNIAEFGSIWIIDYIISGSCNLPLTLPWHCKAGTLLYMAPEVLRNEPWRC